MALLIVATLVFAGIRAQAQVPVVSPAAQQAHSQITAYNGPATCIACHQQQAQEMFGSVHYQEMAETPGVANIDGPAGKGRNGGMVMNSYCGTPNTSSRGTCASCHAGNGRIPSTQISAEQLANLDCMMCHQDAYKRVPAPPYQSVSFPGTNGTTHTIQAVVEDETGFDFVPDTAKMTIPILQAAQTVHLPTRASCLRCHAGAGGGDGTKRGDISSVTVNPPLTSDVHMSPQGADLACANCHSAGGHRVMGRGVDLRPSDSTNQFSCSSCHTDRPHGDYVARTGTTRDVHAGHVACQSCHIPTYAKDKSTEMERSWVHAEFSMAACRGQGGWLPSEVRASNVIPSYQWFDGTSLASVLGQVPVQNALGEYVLALPNGSVQTPNSKLFPMKLHRSDAAFHDATGLLIPHSTWKFFTSGDFSAAVAEGQALSNLEGPASVSPVMEYQTINHGVAVSTSALQCGACHSAYTAGGPVRMNLKADLGYALKGTLTAVCSQCHGSKSSKGFAWDHDYHVRGKGYDCSSCHNFSRPERGLTRISAIRPAAPTGPVATTVSSSSVKLVWADNSTTEQGFRIERSLDGVSFAEIRTVGSNVTTFADTGLTAGTPYFYRVRAYNATGTSDYSMVGRANAASSAQPQPPAVPTGLAANASTARVTLTWNASSGATSYNVKRGTTAGSYVTIATGVAATSYADTSVVNGTTYFYVVSAVNAGGESANSTAASATPQVSAPSAPTGLTAAAGNARVTLGWNASTGATSYNVKRATSASGPFTTVASASTTSYADTSVVNGTTYFYVVSAVNAGGESANSTAASATPQAPPPTVPAAPTGLTATAGNARVTLGWNASTGATSYSVKRATSANGPFATVASSVTTTSYADTSVVNGTTYFYVVSAVNAGGESANSTAASATPQVAAPATPTGLAATAGNARVTLAWNASTGAASYNVKRSTSASGPFSTIAGGVTATSYADTSVVNGTTYFYVVSAVNAGGESANSTAASATPQVSAPSAPTGLTAAAGNARVTLGWNASTGATSYSVKRATSANGPFATVVSSVTTTSYADTSVVNGTTYFYVVSAVNAGGESANSTAASATPQVAAPATPTGLAATAGNARVTLAWNASTGAASYNVKRSTSASGPFSTVASGVTTTSYTDTSVVNGATYFYVVSAVNAGGESANSAAASATPQVSAPSAPTGLTAAAGNARVTLGWNASTGSTSYNVKRATSASGPFSTIASVSTTSYADTSVVNGTTYFYVVSAVNAGGESANSAAASATPQVAAPATPTGMAATAGNARVTLGWNASTGATSYNVKRATSASGPFSTIASGVTTTSYADTSVVNGTTYFYVVSAVNAGGESANSTSVSATPQAPLPTVPSTPTGLSATIGNVGVVLTWNASTGATSYTVKRATSTSGPFTTITSGVTTTSYTDTTIVSGNTYYYVVSAVNAAGESPDSAVVSVAVQSSTGPRAPTELKAEPGDRGTIKLEWKQSTSANIVQNKVYRSTTSGGPYTLIATVSARRSFRDSGLTRGKTYFYVVTAVDGSGRESAYSRQDSARVR